MRGSLATIGDEFVELTCRTFPAFATHAGIHDQDSRLGSFREEDMAAYGRALRGIRSRLEAVAAGSGDDNVERAWLEQQTEAELLRAEELRWWQRDPNFWVEQALGACFFLMIREFAPAPERARSLAARLDDLPGYLEAARATASDSPAVATRVALRSAEAAVTFFAQAVPRWAADLGSEGPRLDGRAERAAELMRAHVAWLREEHLPRSTAAVGVGEDLLARTVRSTHLLTEGPDEIAAWGEELLRDTRERITDHARAMGEDDWRAAVDRLKERTPGEETLLETYAREMRRSEDLVRERGLATVPQDAPLTVMPTPAFWRHLTPYAAYTEAPPFEEDRTGIFWVTPPDGDPEKLKGHSLPSIFLTAVHEGIPGHHLQLSRAGRHPSRARRIADSSLLIEGWAFYCEELASEEGLLTDEERLFQLKDQLWRACRVIIDVRLHQRAMTFEDAVDMLVREADLERPNAEAEVSRYITTPSYQMAYAVGKREIMRLRERVREREGPGFSLRRFHDRVLELGSIPVPLLARALLGP